MKKKIRAFIRKISELLPDQSIKKSKEKWNALADENHKYYIVSKEGKDISDEKFRELGEENYTDLIQNDPLVNETLGNFADKKAVEIGCGAGRVTEFLSQNFAHVDGLDISEKMVEEARVRLAHVKNVTFTATDGMHYPVADNSTDFVFSYIVFQHMPSVEVVKENFKEIKRILKSTGIAKIQVRGGEKTIKGSWYYGPTFNSASMKEMMEEVGLEIVKDGDDTIKRYFVWLRKK